MKIEISERPTCTYKEKKNTKTNLHRNIFVDFFFLFSYYFDRFTSGKNFPCTTQVQIRMQYSETQYLVLKFKKQNVF